METKHQKEAFLVLVAVESFPHPVGVFAEQPYFYTGTLWKLNNLISSWENFQKSGAWGRAEKELKIHRTDNQPQQLAVPADEPDHLLQQQDLVYGKTLNQITVLLDALENIKPGSKDKDIIIPGKLRDDFLTGELSFAFINTDVGNMHHYEHTHWRPLRNFYATRKLQESQNEARLAKRLNTYWKEVYVTELGHSDGRPYIRAIESGMTLTQVVYQRSKKKNTNPFMGYRIFPAVSTVGLRLERSVLASERGRRNAIDYLHAQSLGSTELRASHKNPLSVTSGRAGGIKSEDLYRVALSLGIHAELLAQGDTSESKLESLMEHVEGPPYALFRQLILTLAHAPDCELHNVAGVAESGPKMYPPGMKKQLSL